MYGMVVIVACGLLASCGSVDRKHNYVPEKKVWAKVRKESAKHGLDPHFVYAICHAESSLDAHAETSVARGMMQLTEPAWTDVTERHYRLAFDWEINVETGTRYLAKLKGMLERADQFSYPRLAASYRWGFSRLRKNDFLVSKLPAPRNKIYQKIFAGEIRPVKTPK
jgi:soluble lytic murein transglycosylase-like protein